jgi:hypothetical protein
MIPLTRTKFGSDLVSLEETFFLIASLPAVARRVGCLAFAEALFLIAALSDVARFACDLRNMMLKEFIKRIEGVQA